MNTADLNDYNLKQHTPSTTTATAAARTAANEATNSIVRCSD